MGLRHHDKDLEDTHMINIYEVRLGLQGLRSRQGFWVVEILDHGDWIHANHSIGSRIRAEEYGHSSLSVSEWLMHIA